MGQFLYLSAIKNADIVIGNSSSGISERRHFTNSKYRETTAEAVKAVSVIDCEENAKAIIAANTEGLSPEFKKGLRNTRNPYGSGNASFKIKEYLKHVSLKNVNEKIS